MKTYKILFVILSFINFFSLLNSTNNNIILTKEEKYFIKTTPVIKILGQKSEVPFNMIINEKHNGYSIDLAKIIAKEVGLKLKIIDKNENEGINELIANKVIDIIPASNHKQNLNMFKSRSYYRICNVFVVRNDQKPVENISNLFNKKIVITQNNESIPIIKQNYPSIEIIETKSKFEALNMVNQRKVDAFIEWNSVASYYINNFSFNDLIISGSFEELDKNYPIDLSFFIREDLKELKSIIDKVLNNLSFKQINKLQKKYYFDDLAKQINIDLTIKEKSFLLSNPKIIIGTEKENFPYYFKSLNEGDIGFDKDLIDKINYLTGANFEFVSDDWEEVLKMAEKGEIVGVSSSIQSTKRNKYFDYTMPYSSKIKMVLGKVQDTKNIKTLKDLEGRTIAILKNRNHDELIAKSISGTKIIYANSRKDLIDLVLFGKADVIISASNIINIANRLGFSSIVTLFQISKTTDLVFSINKNYPEALSILNKGLKAIPNNEKELMVKKWFDYSFMNNEKLFNLADEEMKYLSSTKNIKFIDHSKFTNYKEILSTKKYEEITIDYIELFQKKINKKLENISVTNQNEINKLIKKNDIDLIFAIIDTTLYKKKFNFTKPYLKISNVIATYKDIEFIDDIKYYLDKKFAVINNHYFISYLKNKYPDIKLIYVDNHIEGLLLVNSKNVFGFIDTLPMISELIQTNSLENIKISGELELTTNIRIGVKKEDTILLNIINKTINSLSENDHQKIRNKYGTVKYSIKTDYSYLWKISIFLFIIMGIIFIWNRKLKSKNIKLEELHKELEKTHNKSLELEKKNSVLAMVVTANHELNQPLMILSANLEMLKQITKNHNQEKYIKNMNTSLNRINNILLKYKENDSINFEKYIDETEMVVFDK